MTSEVVIDVQQKDISIALMEDKQLVEYQNEPREASFSVGNIYIAKVKKLMPGLNACFVDVGYERDAFLHYLDLGSHFNSYQKYLKQVQSDRKKLFPFSKASKMPELEKDGSIQNVLKAGQEVLVQIVKEPISTKGPRLTGEISFAADTWYSCHSVIKFLSRRKLKAVKNAPDSNNSFTASNQRIAALSSALWLRVRRSLSSMLS